MRDEPIIQFGIIGRQRHNQRNLHQFRRLQHHETQIDPALRPHADCAEKFDIKQQHDANGIGGPSGEVPKPDRHQAHPKHRSKADEIAVHLRLCPAGKIAPRNGIQHQPAQRGNGANHQNQRPVKMQKLCQTRWRSGGAIFKKAHRNPFRFWLGLGCPVCQSAGTIR